MRSGNFSIRTEIDPERDRAVTCKNSSACDRYIFIGCTVQRKVADAGAGKLGSVERRFVKRELEIRCFEKNRRRNVMEGNQRVEIVALGAAGFVLRV